jgi:hypothetical protein
MVSVLLFYLIALAMWRAGWSIVADLRVTTFLHALLESRA